MTTEIEWIDVNEKMPFVKKNGFSSYVLTYSGGAMITTARIRDNEWRNTSEQRVGAVKFWAKLPNLPEYK